ncbi:S-layer homology domain-containing protein, partial [Tepidanaerobacter sp. EBM-38]|uniref:S-layer homology domain-containing protein n=1 Tax=Tepidanaerobacter sp. EBM-38 TaxID=1918496 RepID=UPI000AA0556A
MASKRIRYWVSLILVFTFVIGLTFPAVATSAKAAAGLTDISNHWAKDKISQWVQKGLVSGYTDGTFKPDKSITRAEFMTLVNKVLGFSEKATIGFSDVTSTDWFYEEIAKAVKAGYISGYQDGTVKPNREISRQEAAVALCKALNLEIQGDATEFTDKDAIPNWSRPYIAALAAKGYMGGYPDGSFKAERHITRAETVTMLDKVLATLQISYDVSGVYGPEEGIETISQDVAVNVPGVTLRNMIIEGNLYLNEGIGEGDATLDNVTVKGITTVRGGGKDSIHLINFTCKEIIVMKVGGKVRIVASGNTKVGELKLESGAHIEGNGIVSVTVLKSGEDVILDGAFENVIIEAKAKIEVLKGTIINNLKVNSKSDINLADGATVKDLTLEAAATITGKGTIEKARINADGAKLETEPKKVELAKGVTTEIAGKEVKEDKTSSKSGGGGGSGGGSDKPEIIKVQSVSLDKSSVTLAVYESVYQKTTIINATIYPNNATNKKVTWKSSNTDVATVTGNGLNATVNAVSEGQAIITVTTDDGGKTAKCEVTVVAGEVPVVPVSAISVEGVAVVEQTLTAKVTPEKATVIYQWQRADADDNYVDIENATNRTYKLTEDDIGKYIRVVVTGTGSYTGTKTSAAVGPVSQLPEADQTLAEAKTAVEGVLGEFTASNDTTSEE